VSLKIVVLLSGSGRTLQNLLDLSQAGELPVDVVRVISSSRKAYGLERARLAGVEGLVLRRRSYGDDAAYSEAVFGACREAGAELVVLAGWLKLLCPIPADFQGKVLNIHPALLPSFGGHGFYGSRVHQAVLDHGAKVSGCTVHFVDDDYDQGPIVLQQAVPVVEGDTPDTLAARVFAAETEAYPEAIRLFAAGRLRLEGRVVRVLEGT
jgi:formyltetrahydrofolate-dependent phosphoribosylglycinamide formyltransferase